MLAIINGSVVINPDPSDLEGATKVEGHERAQKFLVALEGLETDAAARLEDLMTEIYQEGMKEGQHRYARPEDSTQVSLSHRR